VAEGHPTRYPELNELLNRLVAGARETLGKRFVGVYLTGSFALGDADEYSDVDFVVVTVTALDDKIVDKLQALHARLYESPTPWAQHLEGSYIPSDSVRHRDPDAQYPYLDNGAKELVPDQHCNTAVLRWTLREHGVVLAGPDPTTLVDPVAPEWLRSEALAGVREYAEWAPEPTKAGPMSRWKQTNLVLTFCRLLSTIATGTVSTKPEAGRWALATLSPEWTDLIQAALDDRPDPWERVHQRADDDVREKTLRFADYAVHYAESAA
jgi:predicted nucleotidyltransferase